MHYGPMGLASETTQDAAMSSTLEQEVEKVVSPQDVARPGTERGVDAPSVRVLHVINGEHYSGAERVQDLLGACLPAEGFDVGFACVRPGRFPTARKDQTAPLYETPMRSRLDWRAVRRIVKIIRDGGYAIVHTHTPRSVLIGGIAAVLARVPMVYHVHSPTSRDTTGRLRNALNALGERIGLRYAARLITVSESLSQHMISEGFDRERIRVVPNGVPLVQSPLDRHPPQGSWTLGTVALFRPRKGTEVLLEAMCLLTQRGHDVRLHAVGGFETEQYERELKARAQTLGVSPLVTWTGFTQDVPSEWSRMDLFVWPAS